MATVSRRGQRILLLWLLAGAGMAATPPRQPELELGELGPDGYREYNFRSPTPSSVAAGWTLNTVEVKALLAAGKAIPIDVQPVVLRPALGGNPADWLPNKPRYNLPGSVWLPNVGYPELTPEIDRYFRSNLAHIAQGDFARGLLFYCIADCWFSWNAVKRAASYGYTRLYWYREGTDGWQAAGLPLRESVPVSLSKSPNE